MSKIVTLSLLLAKSLYKEKATCLFTVIAGVIMLLSLGLSGTEIGVKHKFFEDILLTSQGYFLFIAALFYAFSQTSRDRTLGVFVLPIANGMKRYEYLLAQMVSLGWIISLLFLIFLLLDTGSVLLVEGSVYPPLLWQLFLYFLSAMLVAFLIVSLSQYVSVTNAVLYTVTIFLIGNSLDELFVYTFYIADEKWLRIFSGVFYYLLPNFSLFDLQSTVVNRQAVGYWSGIVLPILYFGIWASIFFLAALNKFQKKALTVGY